MDAGFVARDAAGRIGRATRLPPQFGHVPLSAASAHALQNVHSNEQIIASVESGGKSLSQHSQFGLNSSIAAGLSGTHNAHGKGRSTRSDSLGNNGEAMPELARSVGRPSEPQANGLTHLLCFLPSLCFLVPVFYSG